MSLIVTVDDDDDDDDDDDCSVDCEASSGRELVKDEKKCGL